MTVVIFSVVAFLIAVGVTVTGFGLGTSLTPVFALVYRTQIAVMLVAVVHFLNSAFRAGLFRTHINWGLVARFGIFSIVGALAGSFAQGFFHSDWLKVMLGVVLIAIGGAALVPRGVGWHFPRRFDQIGGFLSGLLGGLLGNQGAIRSAYLVNYDISNESYIATGTLIAVLIDITRIPVYLVTQWSDILQSWPLLLSVTVSAFLGTYLGSQFVGQIPQAAFKRGINVIIVILGLVMVAQGVWQAAGFVPAVIATVATLAVFGAAFVAVRLQRQKRT